MRIKKVTQTTPISGEIVDSLQGSSTDKAPSIRAVNEALETVTSENIYSTNETRIGTWINGKPLYRKVFVINMGTSTAYNMDISSLNIDFVLFGESVLTQDIYTLNMFQYGGSTDYIRMYTYNNARTLMISCGGAYTMSKTCYVTLNYTKTTDTTNATL